MRDHDYRYDFEPHLPRRFPTAFFLALAIVAVFEALFRLAPPDWVIPNASDEIEYYTARDVLEAFGAADIAVVGSSRAREGLAMPLLADSLRARGVTRTIANYACAGSRADETHALVQLLLRHGRPRLLLYGVTSRDLLGNEPRYARSAIFWSVADWRRSFRENRTAALRVLPVLVRSQISNLCYALRYRQRPLALIEDFWRALKLERDGIAQFSALQILRGDVSPNPFRGGWTRAQAYDTHRSLRTQPISEAHVRLYVQGLLENGRYPLGPRRVHELRATIHAAKRSGVPIVLFETPISRLLHRFMPSGVYDEFLASVREVCREEAVPFYTEADLGLTLTDEDFLEQSHMNRRGAEELTRVLWRKIIAPMVESPTPPSAGQSIRGPAGLKRVRAPARSVPSAPASSIALR